MAGINLGNLGPMYYGGQSRQGGQTWDPARQRWVSPEQADVLSAQHRELTPPSYVVSPAGDTFQRYNYDQGRWELGGNMPVSVDALSGVGGRGTVAGGRGAMDPQIRSRLLSGIDMLSSPTALPPGPASYAPRYEQEAEASMQAGAKERAGLRLSASLRALGN